MLFTASQEFVWTPFKKWLITVHVTSRGVDLTSYERLTRSVALSSVLNVSTSKSEPADIEMSQKQPGRVVSDR